MIRALHLGDIHPHNGATFAGKLAIDPDTGRNLALSDLQRSCEFVYAHATQNKARRFDLALIAGDLFDSHKPHPNEIRIIRQLVEGLAEHYPVVAIPGNHDMSQNPMDATALEAIKGIANVHVVERPQTLRLELAGHQVQIACLPYPTKGRLLTLDHTQAMSPQEITALLNQGLAAILRQFVAEQDPDALHLLVAHGTVGNAKVGAQPRTLDHDILIPRDTFDRFHYVALGHIHQPQHLCEQAYYSGSLIRADFGEEHEDKGFNVVELHTAGPYDGAVTTEVKHIRNPHARTFCTLTRAMLEEHDYPDGLQADIVWRFKDRLTDAQDQALRPTLDRLLKTTPWFQLDVERVEETRARDASMTSVMTTDEALQRALEGKVEPADLPALLDKHRALEQQLSS